MTENQSEILTVQEIADYLRTTIRTVRNLIRKGKLKGIKVGRTYRVPREAFEEYLKGQQDNQTP